jgi:hypothetical protein
MTLLSFANLHQLQLAVLNKSSCEETEQTNKLLFEDMIPNIPLEASSWQEILIYLASICYVLQ